MVNFNQLRVFHEAAKCLNFSQAARNLCVTQPAVTTQIRALEGALGIKLFNKRGRRMALSEAGAVLLQHAHEVFEIEKRIELVVGEIRHLKRGLLKIGTTKTYARYLMPSIISRFRESHPEIKIILDEGSSAEVSRSLLDLRNELAVIAMPEPMKGVAFFPFRREEVVLITSPAHFFTRTNGVRFRELAGQLLVMKEVGSGTHALIKRTFEGQGLIPNILLETSNQEFIKEMVERGEGVAFLVRAAIQEDLAQGRLVAVPVLDQQLSFQVHIAHLQDADLSPAAQAFLGILEGEKDP